MDHAITMQVFKVQKNVVNQETGGPYYNNAGVQNAERCESGDRWTML